MNGLIIGCILLLLLLLSQLTVMQGTGAVVTILGTNKGVPAPGPNFRLTLIERIFRRNSYQNRSNGLKFQAIITD